MRVSAERLAFLRLQVISTALGYVLPNLISRKATQHAASILYTFFGLRLLYIAYYSKPQESNHVGTCTLALNCRALYTWLTAARALCESKVSMRRLSANREARTILHDPQ